MGFSLGHLIFFSFSRPLDLLGVKCISGSASTTLSLAQTPLAVHGSHSPLVCTSDEEEKGQLKRGER